jgi:hypothetical protein
MQHSDVGSTPRPLEVLAKAELVMARKRLALVMVSPPRFLSAANEIQQALVLVRECTDCMLSPGK